MENLLIIDPTQPVVKRIRDVAKMLSITPFATQDDREAMNLLSKHGKNINLIIMEIKFDRMNGIELLKRIKRDFPHVSVIVLTSSNRRSDFIAAMQAGAADYVLKPFNNETIASRINAHMTGTAVQVNGTQGQAPPKESQANQGQTAEEPLIDLHHLLQMEMKKAKKGHYNFTLSFLMFYKSVEEVTKELDQQYLRLSEEIYPDLKSLFWDTDYFSQYGTQLFVGLFPFSDQEGQGVIEAKIMEKITSMKSHGDIPEDYKWLFTPIVYPLEAEDTSSPDKLLEELNGRLKYKLSHDKK